MFVTILGWITVSALLFFLGASIYVSFFMNNEQPRPAYRAKRKVSFDRSPKGVETVAGDRRNAIPA